MMGQHLVTVAGRACSSMRLTVPWCGVWSAQLELVDAGDPPSGAVELVFAGATWRGTVDSARSGRFATSTTVLVVGGAGRWSETIAALPNHNDGRVQRSTMAIVAGNAVGESVVVDASVDGQFTGADFARGAAPASQVLEHAFPSVPWWVRPDGVTQVGPRPLRDVTASVSLVDASPSAQSATLALEGSDVSALLPGSSLSDRRLSAPFVVHDVEIVLQGETLRAYASSSSSRDSRGVAALRSIVGEALPRLRFYGLYEYRVYEMAGDRVRLQAVDSVEGMPDVLPVSMRPGVAGAWSELTPASRVLVQFIAGDPSRPVCVGFTRRDNNEPGFLPVVTKLDATSRVVVGTDAQRVELGGAHAEVLRHGDRVQVTLTGGVVPGSGSSGIVNAEGVIALASSVVAVGPPPGGRAKVFA